MRNSVSIELCECTRARPSESRISAAPEAARASALWATSKATPAFLLSLLIAAFPKCPVCWAFYMSLLGSVGLSQLPFLPWMLPVLVFFLFLQLLFLLRAVGRTGYGPLFCCLTGALLIGAGRIGAVDGQRWLFFGAALVFTGSFWSSLRGIPGRRPLSPIAAGSAFRRVPFGRLAPASLFSSEVPFLTVQPASYENEEKHCT